jgi:hypothetical protein
MKNTVFPFILILLLFACTELYEADIDSDQQVLIIDGFLGNTPGNNYVVLSNSLPFDSVGSRKKISGARVVLTDNAGTNIPLKESFPGTYYNKSFAGEINKTYTLTVETPDKHIYMSAPERMLALMNPSKVSGGYGKDVKLVENSYGEINKKEKDICEIYYDFKTTDEDIPRFRFTSSQIVEYTIFKDVMPPRNGMSGFIWYCWNVQNDNSLIFTNEKYRSNADEINKQIVCTTTPDKKILVQDMSLKTLSYTDTFVYAYEYNMIIRINQFRLNSDSYTWF